MYRVQAAGATYFTFGFDNMNGRLSDMSEAGQFRVGETYPCWYDPKNPESAIIKRTFRPIFYAGALIPGFMLLVSVGTLRAPSRAPRKRRRASGELKPDFTAAGRVKLGVVLLVVWIPIALGGAWLLLRSQHNLWFLSLALVLSVIGLVKRFILYWRCRHLADPRVEVDGTRAHVRIDVPSPLRKLTIELVKDEGRKMLHEAEQIAGPVEHWINVAGGSSLVVTQDAGYGDIETEFALH
jgi:hypothetical protein